MLYRMSTIPEERYEKDRTNIMEELAQKIEAQMQFPEDIPNAIEKLAQEKEALMQWQGTTVEYEGLLTKNKRNFRFLSQTPNNRKKICLFI